MTEEDSLKHDEAEALSEIFSEDKKGEGKEAVSEELLQPNILELISSPIFKEYNLDEKDIKIVLILFKSLLNGKDEVRVIEVLKKICNKKIDLLEIKRFSSILIALMTATERIISAVTATHLQEIYPKTSFYSLLQPF